MKKRVATPQVMKMFKYKGYIQNISQDEYVQDVHKWIQNGSIKLDVMPTDVITA